MEQDHRRPSGEGLLRGARQRSQDPGQPGEPETSHCRSRLRCSSGDWHGERVRVAWRPSLHGQWPFHLDAITWKVSSTERPDTCRRPHLEEVDGGKTQGPGGQWRGGQLDRDVVTREARVSRTRRLRKQRGRLRAVGARTVLSKCNM